jgi:hypothetical protein
LARIIPAPGEPRFSTAKPTTPAEIEKPESKSETASKAADPATKGKKGGLEIPLEVVHDDPRNPYVEKSFAVNHPLNKDVQLAGTITLPRMTPPADPETKSPAVIVIHGSQLPAQDPLASLSQYLVHRGIAVVRYDHRGMGPSRGDLAKAALEDLVSDADTMLDMALARSELDSRRVAVIGHAEGTLIASRLASYRHQITGLILLGASGIPGAKVLEQRSDRIAELAGESRESRQSALTLRQHIHSMATTPVRSQSDLKRALLKTVEQHLGQWTKDRSAMQDIADQFEMLWNPWNQRFLTYDPAPTLMTVRCPILGLWGEEDDQVVPENNLQPLLESVDRGGNTKAEFAIMPGLNHWLQKASKELSRESSPRQKAMDASALEFIHRWLADVL